MYCRDTLEKLTDRIYFLPADHRTDRPILAAVLGSERVAMVDAGASPAHAQMFLDALRRSTGRCPDWVVLTHWHWDHTFGLSHLPALSFGHRNLTANLKRLQGLSWEDAALAERVKRGAEITFCAENIAREYGADRTIDVVLPAITFSHELALHLGGVTCELHAIPTDHSDDSVAIYVPEEETLFLGDAMGGNLYAPRPYYSAERVGKLTALIEGLPARWYVESHSEPKDGEGFWAENRILAVVAELVQGGLTRKDALVEAARRRLQGVLPEDYEDVIDQFLVLETMPDWAQPAT